MLDEGSLLKTKPSESVTVASDPSNVEVFETTQADIDRIAPKYVILEADSSYGKSTWRRGFKRFLIGKPLETAQAANERLNKLQALAVFASDALSSVAYATEAQL